MSLSKETIILGGGISGLVAAFRLQQKYPQHKIKLIESNEKAGGWINSIEKDGFILEQGPRGIRPKNNGTIFLKLVEDLGLMDKLISSENSSKKRYIYSEKLLPFPHSFSTALTSPLTAILLEAIRKDWKVSSFPLEEESVASFSNRHFGENFTQKILQPVVSGIWAGDVENLSASAVFPYLTVLEQKEGSLLRSWLKRKKNKKEPWIYSESLKKAALVSFDKGLQVLINKITSHLENNISLSEKVLNIQKNDTGYLVKTDKKDHTCSHLISALPSHVLAPLIDSFDPLTSQKLRQINYAPMAIVSFLFDSLVHKENAFGYLNHQKNFQEILGVMFNEKIFASHSPQGQQAITVMIGGARFNNFSEHTEDDFIKIATMALESHLLIKQEPSMAFCKKITKAIPQFNIGYPKFSSKLFSNFHLVGNYIAGVSVINTIKQAEELIANI
ncbi:protoporphyrinogen oxidase [PVC group bacterium (ex Bugula neritina AB1)]|nr:protoporphyrinogen oxidase [PVC group bacterium (ex Bugula neritina AB1)]